MKKYFIGLLLVSSLGFAQNLNSYKYAVVPYKFSFLKENNMYDLNTLTKMYMQKYGFETYFDNEKAPDDFIENNCNKVFVDVLKNSNLFVTKVTVVLKDCKGTVLYTSTEGKSNEKEYRIAYNLALRMAFDNFDVLKSHKYNPSQKSLGVIGEPALQEPVHNEGKPMILNAKKTNDGFDLITSNPEVVYMNLKVTSVKEVFIATRKGQTGIVFKEGVRWFFEYYSNNQKFTELLNVQF